MNERASDSPSESHDNGLSLSGPVGGDGPRLRASLFGQPLPRLLLLIFAMAMVLLALLGLQLYRVAWADAWHEVHDKHRVLALNLAGPVAAYVQDRRHILTSIADSLGKAGFTTETLQTGQGELLTIFQRGVDGVRSLTLLDARGRLLYASADTAPSAMMHEALADSSLFFTVLAGGIEEVSGVAPSPYDGEPSLMLGVPVRSETGRVVAVLLGELSVSPIEALRSELRFGHRGHAVVVDQFGRVLAHPSPVWAREMRDLSALSVVRLMMAGETGVTEFYAPFVDKTMVAGYTSVPGLGWGIMVAQPKDEIAERVRAVLYRQLLWGLLGLGLVVLSAYLVAAWIARPRHGLTGGHGDDT